MILGVGGSSQGRPRRKNWEEKNENLETKVQKEFYLSKDEQNKTKKETKVLLSKEK